MKLTEKVRIGGRVKRKYDIPKTSYHRLRESNQISDKTKVEFESGSTETRYRVQAG